MTRARLRSGSPEVCIACTRGPDGAASRSILEPGRGARPYRGRASRWSVAIPGVHRDGTIRKVPETDVAGERQRSCIDYLVEQEPHIGGQMLGARGGVVPGTVGPVELLLGDVDP